ncbi:MAG: DUF2169 domain-containing protein [Desulfovibrionaceae bacterium]|nr:DUF2169 domain-containing protein [Desulfovibrionaceae bacterium]
MKPLISPQLRLTSIAVPVRGNLRMLFTATLGFHLNERADLMDPESIVKIMAESLPDGVIPDLGMPKPKAEWLLAGEAIQPGGIPAAGLAVRVSVHTSARTFIVTGDCRDDGRGLPKPKPFAHMPMDWHHACGGTENPPGKKYPYLPNITDDARNISRIVCPCARDARMAAFFSGTYDHAWLRTRWPGVPDDFDWSYYNLAQPEQRLPSFFQGTEAIEIMNMHAAVPHILSHIPGVRLRLFADTGSEEEHHYLEASVQADTLWLFPNALAGMLLWHAALPADDERGTNLHRVYALLEDVKSPPASAVLLAATAEPPDQMPDAAKPTSSPAAESPQQPSAVIPAAEEPQKSVPAEEAVPSFAKTDPPSSDKDEELNPATAVQMMFSDMRQNLDEVLDPANEQLISMGIPAISRERVLQELNRQEQIVLQSLKQIPEGKTPEETLMEAGFSREQIDKFMKAVLMPVPLANQYPSPEAFHKAAETYCEEFRKLTDASDSIMNQIRDMLFPDEALKKLPDFKETWLKIGADPERIDKLQAFLSKDCPDLPGDDWFDTLIRDTAEALDITPESLAEGVRREQLKERIRLYPLPEIQNAVRKLQVSFPNEGQKLEEVCRMMASGNLPERTDLAAFAALCGISDPQCLNSLRIIDPMPEKFSVFIPETAAAVQETPLADRKTEEGHPDSAQRQNTEAQNPSHTQIPPSDRETLLHAIREKRDLHGVFLSDLDLSGIQLPDHSNLSGLILNRCRLSGALLSGCILHNTVLQQCDLTGVSLANADLTGSDLTGSILDETDFSGASANGANFSETRFRNTRITGLQAEDLVVTGAIFEDTSGEKTSFQGTTWDACSFERTSFTDCNLNRTSFFKSTIADTAFSSHMRTASFDSCHFSRCTFSGSDLTNCRFYDSILTEVSLKDAVLCDSSWLRCTAPRLVCTEVSLTGSVFEECRFPDLQGVCISARGAKWLLCDLRGAILHRLDLMEGSLRDCCLENADLRGASLYGADLQRMRCNRQTNLFGADLTRTCLAFGE